MNDDFDYEDEFKVRLTAKTFDHCKALLGKLNEHFTYEPDVHVVVNTLLLTGKFSEIDATNNIRQTFSAPPDKEGKTGFRARLSKESLDICRDYQKNLRRYFKYKPDVHMLVNALILTGKYDSNALVNHIIQAFTLPVEAKTEAVLS